MKRITLIFILILALFVQISFAQDTAEQELRSQELQKHEKALREKIETPKKPVQVEEKLPLPAPAPETEQKIFIKKITVTGVTILSAKQIQEIIAPYENKEVALRDLQKAADLITDAYRQKGLITSRAYLPPQKIEQGMLEIRVIEGVTGDIQIKGNRYFKTSLLRNRILLKKGEPFNYNIFRKGLSNINEVSDRNARAVLMPGKEPGTTDALVEVKDRLPIHLDFDWDNFGSRYIAKDRYSVRFIHNNLLGLDDKLTFQYQLAQEDLYFLKNIRYVLPVNSSTDLGLNASLSRVKLSEEFQDSDARGKSKIYGMFISRFLIDTDNFDITTNLGFDYKDVLNYQSQRVTSHDRLRVAKWGFDIDATDNFGRTIFSNEMDFGIPNIMGGLSDKDVNASRSGSGGKFLKNIINLIRLQRMPFSTTLLWKNQMQLSPYILTSAEQFQIGGIANVRGYPPAEVVGDRGYAMTWEWSLPPYFVPKNIKVPLSKAKLYDTLRVVAFYDWANARLKRPAAGEEKNKTLRGAGCGIRFNLPEGFSLRLDFAWPLDNTPTDSDHKHTWFQLSKSF